VRAELCQGNWIERHRSLFYPALMGLGVGVLVSCAEQPPPPPPHTVAVEPPAPSPLPPRPHRVFPLPAHKPTPPPETPSGAGTEALAPATPEPTFSETSQRALTANQLIGLDEPTAHHLLGVASEQSEAPPAKIWRYRSPTCELDLFFYLDLRSDKMRILHYSFKGESATENCLRSLVVARGN
jgi:hypothetical protein